MRVEDIADGGSELYLSEHSLSFQPKFSTPPLDIQAENGDTLHLLLPSGQSNTGTWFASQEVLSPFVVDCSWLSEYADEPDNLLIPREHFSGNFLFSSLQWRGGYIIEHLANLLVAHMDPRYVGSARQGVSGRASQGGLLGPLPTLSEWLAAIGFAASFGCSQPASSQEGVLGCRSDSWSVTQARKASADCFPLGIALDNNTGLAYAYRATDQCHAGPQCADITLQLPNLIPGPESCTQKVS